jgi:hypothetical protein
MSGQMPDFIIHTICKEPDGIPARRFVSDTGMLPATIPGASGNKILGVTDTAAKFGEHVAVIISGTAAVEAADAAGSYEETTIAGDPPIATQTTVDNGSFISSNALGQAVASATAGVNDLGTVAPFQYALDEGDYIEVILKLN